MRTAPVSVERGSGGENQLPGPSANTHYSLQHQHQAHGGDRDMADTGDTAKLVAGPRRSTSYTQPYEFSTEPLTSKHYRAGLHRVSGSGDK